MSFSEIQLQKDINTINNILKNNGFYFAKVDPSIIKNEELNSIRLKINIDQGKKQELKKSNLLVIKRLKIKNF